MKKIIKPFLIAILLTTAVNGMQFENNYTIDSSLYSGNLPGEVGICLAPNNLQKGKLPATSISETKFIQNFWENANEENQFVPNVASYLLTLMKSNQPKLTNLFANINPDSWKELFDVFKDTMGFTNENFSGIGTLDLLGRIVYYLQILLNEGGANKEFSALQNAALKAMGDLYGGAFGLKEDAGKSADREIMIRELVHLGIHAPEQNIAEYVQREIVLNTQYKNWDKAKLSVMIARAIVAAGALARHHPNDLNAQSIASLIGTANGQRLTSSQVELALKKYKVAPYLETIKTAVLKELDLNKLDKVKKIEGEEVPVPEYLKQEKYQKEYINYMTNFDDFINDVRVEADKYIKENFKNVMTAVDSIAKFAKGRNELAATITPPGYDYEKYSPISPSQWCKNNGVTGFFWIDGGDTVGKWNLAKNNVETFKKLWAETFYENYKVLVGAFVYAQENNKIQDLLQKAFDFEQHCTPSMTRPIADWLLKETVGGGIDELVWEADQFALNNRFLKNTVISMLKIINIRYDNGTLSTLASSHKMVVKNGTFANYLKTTDGMKNVVSKIADNLKASANKNTEAQKMLKNNIDFEYKNGVYSYGSYIAVNDVQVYFVNDLGDLEILIRKGYKNPKIEGNFELIFQDLDDYIKEVIGEIYK